MDKKMLDTYRKRRVEKVGAFTIIKPKKFTLEKRSSIFLKVVVILIIGGILFLTR